MSAYCALMPHAMPLPLVWATLGQCGPLCEGPQGSHGPHCLAAMQGSLMLEASQFCIGRRLSISKDSACSFWGPDRSWDWTLDPGQRWMLQAAIERGVHTLEAFSNSPPYW